MVRRSGLTKAFSHGLAALTKSSTSGPSITMSPMLTLGSSLIGTHWLFTACVPDGQSLQAGGAMTCPLRRKLFVPWNLMSPPEALTDLMCQNLLSCRPPNSSYSNLVSHCGSERATSLLDDEPGGQGSAPPEMTAKPEEISAGLLPPWPPVQAWKKVRANVNPCDAAY